MEIINRLKNTDEGARFCEYSPTGLIVLVGDMKIIVEKYRPYYNGQNKIPCRGCVFRKACMAHLRPDHESVVFAKTRET